MKKTKYITYASLISICLILFYVMYTPHPSKWSKISEGMRRSKIHELIGPPQLDEIDLKNLDFWIIRSGFYVRRLGVSYDNSANNPKAIMIMDSGFLTLAKTENIHLPIIFNKRFYHHLFNN